MSNLKVNRIIPYTTSSVQIGGNLSVLGSILVSGSTEIVYTNNLSNVFSNPKNVNKNITLTGQTNSIIFGPDITIDENYEIYVGDGCDLLIFDVDDFVSTGNTIINNIVSATTIIITGGTTIFTGNTSGSSITNLWVNNLNASESVSSPYFYGDGSTLTNLPVSLSLGKNSLTQNTSTKSVALGSDSVSFGIGNESNNTLSTSFGGGNTAGSKQYDIPQIINGKYILFLEDVSTQFVTDNLVYTVTNTTLLTGTTTTTSTTVTYESEIIGSAIVGCSNYILANNTASIITFTYTDCETGLTAQTQVDFYYTKSICSLTEPTYVSYPWMSAYTYPIVITQIGTCCNEIEVTTATTVTEITTIITSGVTVPFFNNCKTYQLTNNIYPYTYDVFYTSCTGNYEFILLTDRVTTVCAVSTPTRYNNLPLPTAVTVTQISNQCCISYNVRNPAWCPITVFYTDCHTGLSGSTTISGYLSASICSLTEPTFDVSCWSSLGYDPNIYSPLVTRNPNNNSCVIQNIQVVSSSVTINTTYQITSGCTKENTYYTGLTGCTSYIIRGESPILIYTDCFGHYQSISIVTGETYTICSSNYPVVPTMNIPDVEIIPSGKCETLCVNYRFTKAYDTTIPPIWDVYYLDCEFNPQTVKLKNAGCSFEACIILGSELCGTNISKIQLGSCLQPRLQRTVDKEHIGGEITISGLTLTNGNIYNGGVVHPINILQIHTGTTTGGVFSGITGVTVLITGFTGSSNYTIIELSEELPLEFHSGKIVSNYFGLGSFASGLETQAKGMASVSQNMFTTANGDYSHAEGYNTTANGTTSHSEGGFTTANGNYSHVEGSGTTANGDYSHAEGVNTSTNGNVSHAEGYNTTTISDYTHAEGVNNFSGGKFFKSNYNGSTITLDSTYGDLTSKFSASPTSPIFIINGGIVIIDNSIFDGTNTILSIDSLSPFTILSPNISIGEVMISKNNDYFSGDQLIGIGSHSEGINNKVFGNYSHVEGQNNIIFSDYSNAKGNINLIFGFQSTIEGTGNSLFGSNSYVGGVGNIGLGNNQHVVGKYNVAGNTSSLFVVGNGTDGNNRSDVLRVDADKVKIYEVLNIVNIQEYPDNATAISSGLTTGDVYRTGEFLKIIY
jgi:hypothetical protein